MPERIAYYIALFPAAKMQMRQSGNSHTFRHLFDQGQNLFCARLFNTIRKKFRYILVINTGQKCFFFLFQNCIGNIIDYIRLLLISLRDYRLSSNRQTNMAGIYLIIIFLYLKFKLVEILPT